MEDKAMKLIKFNPRKITPSSSSLLDAVFNDDAFEWFNHALTTTAPTANVIEGKDNYRLEIAAPGMTKSDFDIDINNGILTVKAHKEDSLDESNERYTRKEFTTTSFERSFTLTDDIALDKIEANYNDGILKIALPKLEETKKDISHRIAIS